MGVLLLKAKIDQGYIIANTAPTTKVHFRLRRGAEENLKAGKPET
jgi:hypothetical protein